MSRTLLLQAGFEPKWWPYAVKAACFGHNISGGDQSPYFRRHGLEFGGIRIPFGAMIDYYPSEVKQIQRKKGGDRVSQVFRQF